jgi:hypothetical protein
MYSTYLKFKNIVKVLAVLAVFSVGCDNEDELPQVRLFRPLIEADASVDNQLTINWASIKGSEGYTAEISRDSFATIDKTLEANATASSLTFDGLLGAQGYFIRIMAKAASSEFNSKHYVIKASTASIMTSPVASDILDIVMRVRWVTRGKAVTSIKVLKASDNSLVKEISLDDADIKAKMKEIGGLAGSTKYEVQIFSGSDLRGKVDYTTKPSVSGKVIDLRAVPYKASLLLDTLPDIESGSIVILKRGATYEVPAAYSFDKSFTIMSGYDFIETPANIFISSNFNVVAASKVDSLIFRDVNLTGSDYSAKYVFNIGNACEVGKICFESCKAEAFRGIVRLQSAVIKVGTVSINKCIVDSIGSYGVINVDNTKCMIENMVVTNSTIYNAQKFLVSKSASNSVIVENCTLNDLPLGNNYVIDYNAKDVASPIRFANNILGITKVNAGIVDVRGYRAGANTSVDVQNSYSTSDFISTVAANQLPGLTAYTKTAVEVFTTPAKGIFTFKDKSFPGKSTAGDPRWR